MQCDRTFLRRDNLHSLQEPARLWGTPFSSAKTQHKRRHGECTCIKTQRWRTILASGKGGGVLDRPMLAPGLDHKKDLQIKKPRFYKVMLHNDPYNKREYVVQVLLKVIKGLSVDEAVNAMQQAHVLGMACVVACAQQEAEKYCEGLRTNGLIASIEPGGRSGSDSGGGTPST